MKPIRIVAATVLTTTLALAACKNRDEKPIPAPNAQWTQVTARTPAAAVPAPLESAKGRHDAGEHYGASGISWFQGTIEEAFAATRCRCASLFRH